MIKIGCYTNKKYLHLECKSWTSTNTGTIHLLHNGIRNRGRVWSPSIVQYICSRTVSAAVKRGKSPFKENLFNKTIVLSHCHPTLLRFALAFIAAVWNITNFYGKNSILCIYSSYNNFSPSVISGYNIDMYTNKTIELQKLYAHFKQ